MTRNLLTVRELTAAYRATDVLHSVDIDVREGGMTAILGANGAGKTTLLRAISNALVKVKARIELRGRRIDGLATNAIARLGVAHVPDGRGTFTELSVQENLLVGAISRSDRTEVAADLERMYELFPKLAEHRHKMAGLLSGGEQQMVAIARALMLRPVLLMLDEPSFGLAPMVVRQMFEVLAQLNLSTGLGILVVEQNAQLALEAADHAYVLEMGRVAISGPAQELRADPRVRAAYLGIQGTTT
jgi:branched-chain amino acid transport system ATP-binding protein